MSLDITFDSNSKEVIFLCNKDKRLSKVIEIIGELKYKLYNDPYYFFVKTIIGQMISKKVADTLFSRLNPLCPGGITPKEIEKLGFENLHSIGISIQKTNYIMALTKSVLSNEIDFMSLNNLTDQEIIRDLTKLPGIGNWSAKMYLIFVLDRHNVLPYEDGAFIQSFKWLYDTKDSSPNIIIDKCKIWDPYSSIAARYLYRALDDGLTKEPLIIK